MNDEITRLATAAVKHKRLEMTKMAAMTEEERDAYIRAWAHGMAEREVEAGIAYDEMFKSVPYREDEHRYCGVDGCPKCCTRRPVPLPSGDRSKE